MERLKRAALIVSLAERLQAHGSWCGETHLQKATYLVQELADVPMGFEFVLYKHGPFSFQLRDELTALRADRLLRYVAQQYPYGPQIAPTDESKRFRASFPRTLKEYGPALDRIARELGSKGVFELERLATAVYVSKNADEKATVVDRAQELVELKRHISLDDARKAIEEADVMTERAKGVAAA